MAGRFVIRVDYRNGGFHYLTRDYNRTIGKVKTRRMWLMVQEPKDATRFWTRDAAEAAAFTLAATEYKDYFLSVREWDGDRFKKP